MEVIPTWCWPKRSTRAGELRLAINVSRSKPGDLLVAMAAPSTIWIQLCSAGEGAGMGPLQRQGCSPAWSCRELFIPCLCSLEAFALHPSLKS